MRVLWVSACRGLLDPPCCFVSQCAHVEEALKALAIICPLRSPSRAHFDLHRPCVALRALWEGLRDSGLALPPSSHLGAVPALGQGQLISLILPGPAVPPASFPRTRIRGWSPSLLHQKQLSANQLALPLCRCEVALGEFLKEIKKNPSSVKFAEMANILVIHCQAAGERTAPSGTIHLRVLRCPATSSGQGFSSGLFTSSSPCLYFVILCTNPTRKGEAGSSPMAVTTALDPTASNPGLELKHLSGADTYGYPAHLERSPSGAHLNLRWHGVHWQDG